MTSNKFNGTSIRSCTYTRMDIEHGHGYDAHEQQMNIKWQWGIIDFFLRFVIRQIDYIYLFIMIFIKCH